MTELFLKQYVIKGGKIIAVISFILGTLLLVLFLNFRNIDELLLIGILFVEIAFVVNTIMGLLTIACIFIYKEYYIELFKTLGVILLNIPIGIGYFYLLISILFSSTEY